MSHLRRVYVVGRNEEWRRQLTQDVMAVSAEVWPFGCGSDFLHILDHLAPGCVLVDMDDSDIPGIEILSEMAHREIGWPVVAVSGRDDVELVIAAMKLGALDFLRQPVGR